MDKLKNTICRLIDLPRICAVWNQSIESIGYKSKLMTKTHTVYSYSIYGHLKKIMIHRLLTLKMVYLDLQKNLFQ